jgi:hypothetical protein
VAATLARACLRWSSSSTARCGELLHEEE